ncbi:Zona pellucida sperm-binding protein 3 [Merluccius polli]|uniref:Zona pellucida sperm-binding protein 3 n=1 Tax=Merluccius polli TaxID=89951 RepID=A0AA47P8B8_MERPO|nr:Zona pellucida sperm-binding protein 3 [Merluccius polli]
MVMKWTAVYLVTVAVLSHLCNAQYGKPKPFTPPKYQRPAAAPVQAAKTPQAPIGQIKQEAEAPLQWTYPLDPKVEPKPEVPFTMHAPVQASSVAVECREMNARVEVKKDMFGTGQLINPADLTLGGCAAIGEDGGTQVLIFETELHLCGSQLTMTDDALIYAFTLNYLPQSIGSSGVVRTNSAVVRVECHYPRKLNVSSLPLDPYWIPFAATKVSNELLYFELVLKTDDWLFDRPSYQYFLGSMINIEAIVKQYFHVPLRVYVESCTATLEPDLNSNPKYNFIENYGCLVDGRLTGSSSKFLPRTVDNVLQFQLEAFRFQGATSGLMYITCTLKATSAAYAIDAQHKACSFDNGWREASGVDAVCGSCESGSGGGFAGGSGGSGGSFGGNTGGFPSNPSRKTRSASESESTLSLMETIHIYIYTL